MSPRAVNRPRGYWLRLARAFVLALALALFALPFGAGLLSAWGLTRIPCFPGVSPDAWGMAYEDVSFPSTRGITQRGYFIPGDRRATVMIVPAFNLGRGAELHYADVFHRAGFNVLTYNSRVCTSQGWMSLGYQEAEDVAAAYEYLRSRPDVDPLRVGLHGYSAGGAAALMAMPRLPAVGSVSAEGGYHDYAAMLGLGSAVTFFDSLFQTGVVFGYRLATGDDVSVLSPLAAIRQIGARPVLLIYGSREISLSGARVMLQEAQAHGVPAELWVVEGADHGDYLTVARQEFERRVVAFHRRALLDTADREVVAP